MLQAQFTGIDTDVNALIHFVIHNKLTLACIMRVRDPVDYSSVVLGVFCGVLSCYRSLNRGAINQSNYHKRKL